MKETPYGKILVSVSEDRINFYIEVQPESDQKVTDSNKKTLEMLF